MPENWITIQEACQMTGYNAEYLRRLIRNGKVKARKVSIVWVVDQDSLQDYASQNKDTTDRRRGPKERQSS
jgi:excisionase family DNA binding protein